MTLADGTVIPSSMALALPPAFDLAASAVGVGRSAGFFVISVVFTRAIGRAISSSINNGVPWVVGGTACRHAAGVHLPKPGRVASLAWVRRAAVMDATVASTRFATIS